MASETLATGWYALALSGDVEPGTAIGAHLLGRELVVWRDGTGVAHVWEDRCPHRGMRLSFGFVRKNRLACLYHGWQFDAAGRCRTIPAHPQLDVPATITTERLVCAQQAGFVWTYLGEGRPEEQPKSPPPGGNAETSPVRSLAIDAPAGMVIEALRRDGARFEGDGTLLISGCDETRILAAVQPLASARTMLHLAVDPAQAARRQTISRWAESLRREIEVRYVQETSAVA